MSPSMRPLTNIVPSGSEFRPHPERNESKLPRTLSQVRFMDPSSALLAVRFSYRTGCTRQICTRQPERISGSNVRVVGL